MIEGGLPKNPCAWRGYVDAACGAGFEDHVGQMTVLLVQADLRDPSTSPPVLRGLVDNDEEAEILAEIEAEDQCPPDRRSQGSPRA